MRRPVALTEALLADIAARLAADKPVRRVLPGWGRIAIERRLPFLVVYRRPPGEADDGTERLAVGTASYLLLDGSPERRQDGDRLIEVVATTMKEAFGAVLVIELWSGGAGEGRPDAPGYRICHRQSDGLDDVTAELALSLGESRILGVDPAISIHTPNRIARKGAQQLLTAKRQRSIGATLLGIEVRPVYRAPDSHELYPSVLRQMRRRVTIAVDRAVHRFTEAHTTARPATYQALRRKAFTKALTQIDFELAEIGSSFDVLLQVTPVNIEEQWHEFRRRRYARAPRFRYRPLSFDPGRMKHRLWAVRPERVEDPTFMYLFRGVQRQIDRQLSLVSEVERPEFVHTSLQLHGGVERALLGLARTILEQPRCEGGRGEPLDAAQFEALVRSEIMAYREERPGFGFMPRIRDDLYAGLMVSHGHVFIGAHASIPALRADALIQHEVGTHVVTFHNGARQPLRLLSVGLPGYDELQEGLGVLGEYLVGGLDAERLRTLAARVVAVAQMLDGAEFVDVYRGLVEREFSRHAAFTITTRVFRGGGLAKDAMYLRGFSAALDYLAGGCDVANLYIGKYAVSHVPVIEELLLRKVLVSPDVLPRYLLRDDVRSRLDRVRSGVCISDLAKEVTKR